MPLYCLKDKCIIKIKQLIFRVTEKKYNIVASKIENGLELNLLNSFFTYMSASQGIHITV